MSTTATDMVRNGIDTGTLYATLDAVAGQPELAHFQFRAANEWIGGAHNRSTIQSMYGAGAEVIRDTSFTVDAGEPAVLLGEDEGPNPAEYALHALAACLTTTLVYVAAARKVRLTKVTSRLEGDVDVRGALGLDDEVPNGFQAIRVHFDVEGDASPEQLRELVERAQQRSLVFATVTTPVPVTIDVITP